jgi:hypothetical protein
MDAGLVLGDAVGGPTTSTLTGTIVRQNTERTLKIRAELS